MSFANIREEIVTIPTYPVGKPEKNPIFLEKRVYQGSCGKVYPYPTIETISDEKIDKEYKAVFLENEYLLIEILPELGGRVQRAYDKTNGYDFVYYNQVIKPALVGLLGPWISGGIEFNWPQHHRPTTFMPVEYEIRHYDDGSVAVITHDVDQMYGTSASTEFRLYPGKAYLEIKGQLYNGTSLPQTFLWWANPAVSVNDYTKSIFPPDVHVVMDHGKRDVSDYPIAHGVYYKHDYSEGVDISRYKNIPVPTSYMAEKSKYDFVGGYDYSVEAGLLHVADHHVSPGKKQWTWGCGDFGKAWDRNLTDEDGPYIELMTGMFTDNQPDFSWIEPHEEKVFTQYFMPYKAVGQVHNATKDVVIGLEVESGTARIKVYASSVIDGAKIRLTKGNDVIFEETANISPVSSYVTDCSVPEGILTLGVYDVNDNLLVKYEQEPEVQTEMPSPAEAIGAPETIETNEELLLAGKHLEQYRHATYLPDGYYLEGLKRDPMDYRINTAYGQLLLRRGMIAESEQYFRNAIERLTKRNPNPFDSEAYYLLGLSLFFQKRMPEAYDSFYKACWKSQQQEMSYYYMAIIAAADKKYDLALEHIERSVVRNYHNVKARAFKGYILGKLGRDNEAADWMKENLKIDAFDVMSSYELNKEANVISDWAARDVARVYAYAKDYEKALDILSKVADCSKLTWQYKAYYAQLSQNMQLKEESLRKASETSANYCFPNNIEDIEVLNWACDNTLDGVAEYLLGNLYYDKLQWEKSKDLWEKSIGKGCDIPTVYRNLSLLYYNKTKECDKARNAIEKAFDMDSTDARVFMERDQLYKKLEMKPSERLSFLEQHQELLPTRDDLYVEYITVLNDCEQYEKAYDLMANHHFHPWEGGEGKITGQYVRTSKALAAKKMESGEIQTAEGLVKKAFNYPENLGEGKLEGCKDNDLYYLLGQIYELEGKKQEADDCYRAATLGMGEIGMSMYYNDQPVDMVLYQGLASIKLGNIDVARSMANKLKEYANAHMNDVVAIEYFAVSLPDFLIYEDDLSYRNKIHCRHMLELAEELYEAI